MVTAPIHRQRIAPGKQIEDRVARQVGKIRSCKVPAVDLDPARPRQGPTQLAIIAEAIEHKAPSLGQVEREAVLLARLGDRAVRRGTNRQRRGRVRYFLNVEAIARRGRGCVEYVSFNQQGVAAAKRQDLRLNIPRKLCLPDKFTEWVEQARKDRAPARTLGVEI